MITFVLWMSERKRGQVLLENLLGSKRTGSTASRQFWSQIVNLRLLILAKRVTNWILKQFLQEKGCLRDSFRIRRANTSLSKERAPQSSRAALVASRVSRLTPCYRSNIYDIYVSRVASKFLKVHTPLRTLSNLFCFRSLNRKRPLDSFREFLWDLYCFLWKKLWKKFS